MELELREHLAIERKRQKMNIKALADASQLSAATVSRVLGGQSKPSLEVMERMARALGYELKLVAMDDDK